jgi:hypothetical protein
VPSERRTDPLARRGVDQTDRCPDVDLRTLPVDEQENQRDQKGRRCGDEILEQKHSLCGDLTVWNGIELYAVTLAILILNPTCSRRLLNREDGATL